MSNRSLRTLTITLAGVMLLSTAACGAGGSSKAASAGGQIRIGVTTYEMSSFITAGQAGIDAYAKANNIDVLWNSANNDVSQQANQIDQYIQAGVNAIIVMPVQADSLAPEMASAKAKKIPILDVNTSLHSSDLAGSVLPNDVQAGEHEMQMMATKLGGKGNIVVLQGVLGASGTIDRTKGIKNVLAKYPNMKILAMDTANWNRPPAVDLMSNWITRFGSQINGVVSENDDMGLGALQAEHEAHVTLPVVGVDGIQDGLTAVKNGTFIGTNLQDGTVELATGLAVAAKIVRGEKVDKNPVYLMPEVTTANVDTFMKHVVTAKAAFLAQIPQLVAANLKTGNIANEGTK